MRTISLLALALLASAGIAAPLLVQEGFDLKEPKPAVGLHPASLPDVASVGCTSCHMDVAKEWASTAHGIAWLDHEYQAAIADRKRPELCAGCHIPEPLLATGELPRRAKARAESVEPRAHGITCVSCHGGADGVVHGPRGGETPAHPTKKSAPMTKEGSSALCALCHRTNIGPVVGIAKDFPESKAAASGGSCVACHMAPVERRWATTATGEEDDDVPLRIGRSHALQTPRDPSFLRQAFSLRYKVEGETTTVTVMNRTGHRVPGLTGRTIRFELEAIVGGASSATGTLELDTRAYLPLDGEKTVVLSVAAESVRVRGLHVDPRQPEAMLFLDGDVAEEN